MFQRMRSAVSITVDGVDMLTVSDVEVKLIQEDTGVEMLFTGSDVAIADSATVQVEIPKEIGMQLEVAPLRGQIMFTRENGYPDASKPFTVPVSELIKEEGYGS